MFRKSMAVILSATLIWGTLVSQVSAAIINTQDALSVDARSERIEMIQTELAREDVQQALTQLGVDPMEAQLRVASLSDQELLMLEEELETLPAGGSFFGVVGVVFVILLILELVGVTNIFTKV